MSITLHLEAFNGNFLSFINFINIILENYTVTINEYIKSSGPRFDPCGTPDVAKTSTDWKPEHSTYCLRLLRYEERKLSMLIEIPWARCFLIRMLWSSLSKALEKSVQMTSVWSPMSIESVIQNKFVTVDLSLINSRGFAKLWQND